MCVLDSQCFPHILDRILEYSSPEDLLSFRSTSHDLRNRADKLLFDHISISCRSTHWGEVVEATPHGSNLRFEFLSLNFTGSEPNDPVLAASQAAEAGEHGRSDAAAHAVSRKYIRARIEATTAVDRVLVFLDQFFGPQDPPLWPHWRVYRTRVSPDRDLGLMLHRKGAPGYSLALYCRPGALGSLNCPLGLYAYYAVKLDPRDWIPPRRIDLVVHLLARETRCEEHWGGYERQGIPPTDETDTRSAGLTIVGGGQECRRAMGLDASASDDMVRAVIDKRGDVVFRSPVAEWRHGIRLVSPDEYVREVGEVQAALETRSNPYADGPAEYLP